MAEQISDLYVLLRADNGQLIGGFTEASVSGEEMAAKVAAVTASVEAEIKGMNASLISVAAAADEMALQTAADFEAMSVKTTRLGLDFEAMAAKAAASNEAIGASMAKAAEEADATASANLTTMAKVGAGVALAGGIVIAATAKMSGDFESATNRLVTSAGESKANLDMIRQGILQMAGQVGDSALDLAQKGGYAVESMGYHGAAALDALRAAAQGAKAENADLGTVAHGLAVVMNDYHDRVGDAATTMSKLVTAVSDAGTTFEDFTGALHNISPIAASMNVPFDDIAGALAAMTTHGYSADQASQNLANSLRTLQKPSSDMTNYLAQLGITASDLTDKLATRGLTGTLQDISQAIMNKMGPSGKVLISAFNESKQAGQDLQIMMQNMPASLQKTAQAFLNGQISVNDWRQAVKALPADQQGMATQFASLANRADGFNNILKQGGPAAMSYTQALQRATGNATSLNVALMTTGNNAASTNKIIKDIAGSSKEADGSVKGWSEIQSTFNQKLDEAKSALGAMAIQLGQVFLPILSKVLGAVADFANWLSKHPTLLTAAAIAVGVLTVAALAFAAAMWAVNIALYANPIVFIITLIIVAVVALVAAITFAVIEIHNHWDDIVSFFSGLWDGVKNVFNTVVGWIGDRISDIVDWFKSLPQKIGDALSSFGSMLGNAAKNAWNSFTKFISDGFENGLKFFKDFPAKAGFAIGYLAGTLIKKAKEAWDGFSGAIVDGFHNVVKWFQDLPKNIEGLLTDARNWLTGPGKDMVEGWLNSIEQKAEDAWNWFLGLGPKIVSFFTDSYHWLINTGRDIIHGAEDGITNAWHDVENWWSATFPDGITKFFRDAVHWLYDVGRDILKGLVNGISSAIGWVEDTVSSFISNLISGVKAGFDSHSPSRVFHAIGEDLMHGLGNGINAKAGAVIDLAKKTTDQIVGAANIGDLNMTGNFTSSGISTGINRGAQGGNVTIIGPINVAGNVRTTQQFIREIQQELLRYGIRNFGNGSTYLGFGAAS